MTTASFSVVGTYVLRLTASDSVLSASDTVTVTVNAAATNAAPTVSAGPDRTITLPSIASLQGSASDDGRPSPPGALTLGWTRVSGPGTVIFSAPAAAVTTASFSVVGTYVLRLTASDSVLSASDTVTVIVNAAATNAAPTVSAGPDRTITLPSIASLQGSASDDGRPSPPGALTLRWARVIGPGTVVFSAPAAAVTSASFSAAGTLRSAADRVRRCLERQRLRGGDRQCGNVECETNGERRTRIGPSRCHRPLVSRARRRTTGNPHHPAP